MVETRRRDATRNDGLHALDAGQLVHVEHVGGQVVDLAEKIHHGEGGVKPSQELRIRGLVGVVEQGRADAVRLQQGHGLGDVALAASGECGDLVDPENVHVGLQYSVVRSAGTARDRIGWPD